MNDKTTLIRTILATVAVIIVVLGTIDIIPKTISLIIGSIVLAGTSVWNGVEAIRCGRKRSGIVNIITAAVLVVLCLTSVLL